MSKVLIAIILGLITNLAFPPVGLPIFMVIGLGGYYYLLLQARAGNYSLRKLGTLAFAYGYSYYLVGYYWLAYALPLANVAHWSIGVVMVLALAVYYAIYTILCTLIWQKLSRKLPNVFSSNMSYVTVLFVLLWWVSEYLRSYIIFGFPWNMTVHSLASSLTLTQITYYIGVDLANLLVIAICAFAGLLLHHYRNQRQYQRAGCGLLALIALLYAAGAYRLYDNPTKYHDDVKIRIIQPNIAQNRKWDRQETYDIITEIVKQTNQDLGDDIDYIFFPESTISGTYLDYDDQARLLWSAINGDAIKVFGHNKLARYGKHDYKIWNRLYVQQGQFMVDSYDKNILVPFGEYMPLRQYLPFEKITAGSIDFSRGGGNKIINRGKISFIPLICYEALFPYDLIADDDNDADVLVTISNDAWYGYSSGPYQHAYYARLRAVASGKPMIRVANTGISFMTDKVGRFIKKTKLAEKITIDTMLSQ